MICRWELRGWRTSTVKEDDDIRGAIMGSTYPSVETCNVGISKDLRRDLTIRVDAILLLATANRYNASARRLECQPHTDTSRLSTHLET